MDSLECFETFERLLRREAARVLERCSGDLSLLRPRHSNKECSLSASADAFERPAIHQGCEGRALLAYPAFEKKKSALGLRGTSPSLFIIPKNGLEACSAKSLGINHDHFFKYARTTFAFSASDVSDGSQSQAAAAIRSGPHICYVREGIDGGV
jgi:hypothetical protein